MVALWIPSPLDTYNYSRKSSKVKSANCTKMKPRNEFLLCKMLATAGQKLHHAKVMKWFLFGSEFCEQFARFGIHEYNSRNYIGRN